MFLRQLSKFALISTFFATPVTCYSQSSKAYTYDALGRLVRVVDGTVSSTYVLDAAGN